MLKKLLPKFLFVLSLLPCTSIGQATYGALRAKEAEDIPAQLVTKLHENCSLYEPDPLGGLRVYTSNLISTDHKCLEIGYVYNSYLEKVGYTCKDTSRILLESINGRYWCHKPQTEVK